MSVRPGPAAGCSSARASSSAETTIVTSAAGATSRSGSRTLSSGWSVSSSSGSAPTCSTVRLVGELGVAVCDREQDRGDVVVAAAVVRRLDQRVGGRVEVGRGSRTRIRAIVPASTIVVRPSEQSRKTSPSRRLDGERVDVDVGLGPERARDHRALRVDRRLLRGELAAPHELGDERVVVGQLLELLVAQPVGARVADMPDRDLPVGLEDRNRHRRAHPRRGRRRRRRAGGRAGSRP